MPTKIELNFHNENAFRNHNLILHVFCIVRVSHTFWLYPNHKSSYAKCKHIDMYRNSRMHTSISWLEYKRPVGTPRSKSCWFIPRYWFIRCMYKVLEVFKLQPRITKYTNEKITEKLDDKTFLDLTSGYKNANLVLKLSQSQHRNINFQISQRGYVEWWIE